MGSKEETRGTSRSVSGKGFIPPTGEVLYRWMYFEDGPYPQDRGEFNRWLASVKAEAWEQGKRAEEKAWIHAFDGHPVEEGDMCDQCSTDNPYREQEVT